jgi:hypothetical protein
MINTEARPIVDSHNRSSESIPAAPVIDGVEKLDDWLKHRGIVVQELCPVGALETLYAKRAALNLWRLDRVIGFENAAKIGEIEAGSEKNREDSPESRSNRVLPDHATLQTIIKYEAHVVRCLSSTMAELRRLQKERRQGLRDVKPAGRVDRAGVCLNQQIKGGSPGGSPSQIGSPMHSVSPCQKSAIPEMLNPGGRGADRAGVCQNQQIKGGSPGGSPSRKSSTSQMSSTSRKKSIPRSVSPSKKASPIPKPPPLLTSITNRRRLEEYTRGEIFERNLASATLGFAMIPCS